MAAPNTPRSSDRRALTMLAMRDGGRSDKEIAAAIGTTPGVVKVTVHRIKRDLAASEGTQFHSAGRAAP